MWNTTASDRRSRVRIPLARFAPALTAAVVMAGCVSAAPTPPTMVPHALWEAHPPLGHEADADRRNLAVAEGFRFRNLGIVLASASPAPPASGLAGSVVLALEAGERTAERQVAEGAAFSWAGYRIAVLAVRGEGELGAGLTTLEVATLASLPPHIAESDSAGGAAMRLRVPHRITHVTLHHTGSAQPLRPEDDPTERLRGLQRWGASDRNWWDVPYHYLIGLDGTIFQGRDHRYMGETNTRYDPRGHFLISVIGNYEQQEPTPAQIDAIADLMAWAIAEYRLPLDRIGGHYHYAETGCPGRHLRPYLEDGTLRRAVEARLGR